MGILIKQCSKKSGPSFILQAEFAEKVDDEQKSKKDRKHRDPNTFNYTSAMLVQLFSMNC